MGMGFGSALDALKNGEQISRSGWNGKGTWLMLVNGQDYSLGNGGLSILSGFVMNESGELYSAPFELLPWIGMKTADNKFVPWLASQTDILAVDWVVVE